VRLHFFFTTFLTAGFLIAGLRVVAFLMAGLRFTGNSGAIGADTGSTGVLRNRERRQSKIICLPFGQVYRESYLAL